MKTVTPAALLATIVILLSSCATATSDPGFALSHTASATSIPTLATLPKLYTVIVPSSTTGFNLVTASPLASGSGTPSTIVSGTPPAASPGDPPPLALLLPAGWRATYTTTPAFDQGRSVSINVAGYAGPLSNGGTGFIYILWNYPSLVPVNPVAIPTSSGDLAQAQLYSDGRRFLQGTILDVNCTVGNYGRQTFPIGGQVAVGQMFQSSQCPDGSPDVAGWYAGVNAGGQRLLFYAYIQPVSSFLAARADLQQILNSVVFRVPTTNSVTTATVAPSGQAGATPLQLTPTTASPIVPLATGTPVLN